MPFHPDSDSPELRRRFLAFGTLLLLCAAVGVVAGLGAAAFHYLLVYDEQILNPPQPEAKDTPVSRAIRRWLPGRAAARAKDDGSSRPN